MERETLRDEDVRSEVREGSAWATAEVEDMDSTDSDADSDSSDTDTDADDAGQDADTTDPS